MVRLSVFVAILLCLAVAAFSVVLEDRDWTVVTMAPDGSWGAVTEASVGQALAKAIGNCKAMSWTEIGCGAQSRAIQAGWILATRCGDRNIVMAERLLADAEQAVRKREIDLRKFYAPDMAPCTRVLTVNPRGAVLVAKSQHVSATVTD